MSRTTIDFGIDLGTTNSAIALLKGVTPEIIKNNRDNDITPSAVHISKKGTIDVGFNAKQRIMQWPDDTFIEFKRRMGTDHVYEFESSGQKRRAEGLSAEVLKILRSDAQAKTEEPIEAAVITVPAAFELHQCDATRRAAELAGFQQSPLLQEPVAAALAYGFQADRAKSYWLVYDFGGGTFDAALIKAEEGTIHVVNHGGDNFLGGSDIDWALIEKIIIPRVVEEFGLEQFDRAHAGKGGRWRQAFARLKFAAEQAKIDLSRKEKVALDTSYASNIKDEKLDEVVIEELDMEITRTELIRVAEPLILQSIAISKRVLKEKNLAKEAVDRVILVGGPTIAQYFREILANNLGIRLDTNVDPLTVVAKGAAVFAATQRLTVTLKSPVAPGEYVIDLKYKPVGLDSAPVIGGKVSGAATKDFTAFTVELVDTKTQWRSGKIPLKADGVFMATLHAERGERNSFTIELNDPAGRKQKVQPDTLTYTIGVGGDVEQPITNSMGISLATNEYEKLFDKGSGLPQKKTRDFRTVKPLHQGSAEDEIIIPVIEGENDLADRNRQVGRLVIKGTDIRRNLPAGSTIEVTLRMDESRILLVKAYVQSLDEEFEQKIDMGRHSPSYEDLKHDFDTEMKRFREAKSKAAVTEADSAEELVEKVEQSPLLLEVKETLSAAKGDPDAAGKCERRLLELKLKLDEATNSLEWPSLVAEAQRWLEDLKTRAEQHGTDQQQDRATDLAEEVANIISQRKMDKLRKKLDQIARLYFEILFAQPGYWVQQFQKMEKQKAEMTDQTRAANLTEHGRDCIAKNNTVGLQNVVRQLWDLLPREVAETTQRGYQAGIVR